MGNWSYIANHKVRVNILYLIIVVTFGFENNGNSLLKLEETYIFVKIKETISLISSKSLNFSYFRAVNGNFLLYTPYLGSTYYINGKKFS